MLGRNEGRRLMKNPILATPGLAIVDARPIAGRSAKAVDTTRPEQAGLAGIRTT
jgi:hypothetical protein